MGVVLGGLAGTSENEGVGCGSALDEAVTAIVEVLELFGLRETVLDDKTSHHSAGPFCRKPDHFAGVTSTFLKDASHDRQTQARSVDCREVFVGGEIDQRWASLLRRQTIDSLT